ncbi:hypothetical protein [Yoonia sp. MH D7]
MKKNRIISRSIAAPARPTLLGAAIFASIVTLPIGVLVMLVDALWL